MVFQNVSPQRGKSGSSFDGARSLYNFYGSLYEKEYTITNTKLYIFIIKNISQQITNLKKADKHNKHHKNQKNDIIFLLCNSLTHMYDSSFATFLAAYTLIASSYDNDFVLSFSTERIKREFTIFNFHCYTMHVVELLILLHRPMHLFKILHINTLKTLQHVSVLRPSSGSYNFLVNVTLEIVAY